MNYVLITSLCTTCKLNYKCRTFKKLEKSLLKIERRELEKYDNDLVIEVNVSECSRYIDDDEVIGDSDLTEDDYIDDEDEVGE